MEEPRAAKANELQQVIDLINCIFRESSGFAPTMGEEFPLLLCENNLNNIRIISDNSKPVSIVNYYMNDMFIQGSTIKTASIGAVCTASEYRGKNLASIILDDVEARLKQENVDVMLVSGARNLYLRRGCCIVGGFSNAVLVQDRDASSGVEIIDFNSDYLKALATLYSREPVRYYRTLYEFKYFLKGATTPSRDFTYRVYMIKRYKEIVGYVVLRIIHGDDDYGSVVEYAGDREAVYESLFKIIEVCSLKSLTLYLSNYDPLKSYLKSNNVEVNDQNQLGSIKIINSESLMNKLKPYFMQYLPYGSADYMSFQENEKGYIFNIDGEELCISDLDTFTQLIFGSKNGQVPGNLNEALACKPMIRHLFDSVFPIPFPQAGSINYI